MLDRSDIKEILAKFNESDNQRELLIKKSRDVLKLSKQLIYSLHREDLEAAKSLSSEIKKSFHELSTIASKNPELKYSGSYKISGQEYVEAMCYYGFVAENRLPTHKELQVDHNAYLAGLCDLQESWSGRP